MSKRASNGRFVKNELNMDENSKNEEGFLNEVRVFQALFYRIWRFLPFVLLLYILWRYFQVTLKFEKVLIEIVCGGANCTCSCGAMKEEIPKLAKNGI